MKPALAFFAWFTWFACLAAPALAVQKDDFERLVPKDATLLARAESVEGLAAQVERMRTLIAPTEAAITPAKLLEDLPLDATKADTKGPIGFAMVMLPAGQFMTFILKSADPQALVESVELPPGSFQTLVSGPFVGLMMNPPNLCAYALNEAPGRVTTGRLSGLCSVRIDLEKLIQIFRPVIDMGLAQVEQMLDSGAMDSSTPFDMSAFMEVYLDFIRDLRDSAELLDAAVEVRGSKADLRLGLSTLEGSPLAGYAKPEKVDWRGLARRLDGKAAVQMAASFDSAGLFESILPMYESILNKGFTGGNEESAAAFHAYFARLRQLLPLMGRTYATSVDLGPEGVRVDAYYKSPDPPALLAALRECMADPAFASFGLRIGEAAKRKLGGLEVTQWSYDIDAEKLLSKSPKASLGEAKPEDLAKVKKLMALCIGEKGGRFNGVASEQGFAFVNTWDDAAAASALSRLLGSGGSVPPQFERAVSILGSSNPGILLHYDLGRVFHAFAGMFELMDLPMDPTFGGLATHELEFTLFGGFEGRHLAGGVTLDLEQIGNLIRQSSRSTVPDPKKARMMDDFDAITVAVEEYQLAYDGKLPESLAVLATPDSSGTKFAERIPKDPWDRAYVYEILPGGKQFLLTSLGRDGKIGGEGEDADFSSADSGD
jgi:general secretion pathway protein G